MKRASITLMICALAGGAAVVGLARPAAETPTAAATAPAAASTDDPYGGTDQSSGQAATAQAPAAASAAPAPAPADPAVVTIEGFAFGGTTVASPGQSVTVQNLDSAPHTMTARDGSFDSGNIDGGGTGSLTLPTEPGTYEFFCAIHPSMVGTITVQA